MLDIELPDDEWDTIGGFVLDLFGRIPDAGDEKPFDGLSFKAEVVQGRRIAKVLISRAPAEPEPGEPGSLGE